MTLFNLFLLALIFLISSHVKLCSGYANCKYYPYADYAQNKQFKLVFCPFGCCTGYPKYSNDACCSPDDINYINGSNVDLNSMVCYYYPSQNQNAYNITFCPINKGCCEYSNKASEACKPNCKELISVGIMFVIIGGFILILNLISGLVIFCLYKMAKKDISRDTNVMTIHLDPGSQPAQITPIDVPPSYKENGLIINTNNLIESKLLDSNLSSSNPPSYDSIKFDTNINIV